MRKFKKVFLLLLFFNIGLLAKTEAVLKLDTRGHTGTIRDIIVTKLGDIISASDDKTIRVWSSKTGKEKRKILGQIGAGVNGMISTYPKLISKILETMASASPYSGLKSPIPNEYNIGQVLICSIALSPNEEFLAIGGIMSGLFFYCNNNRKGTIFSFSIINRFSKDFLIM